MDKKIHLVLKAVAKTFGSLALGVCALGLFVGGAQAESSWDSERLNLETSIQKRVEDALSKILPAGQFVLVIRIEPWGVPIDSEGKPIEQKGDGFYLPGVPERTKFDSNELDIKDLVSSMKPDSPMFKRFIRRISATLVIDQDISEDTVNKVRELTKQMIGLDPVRGDTLDIQRTVFQKGPTATIDNSTIAQFQRNLQSNWMIVSLSLIVFSIVIFFLFIFGPLRGFLNRFVQVLPTLKPNDPNAGRYGRFNPSEMPYFQMMSQLGQLSQQPANASNFSGMLQVENPNKVITPFGFIREDHLGNLAILLSRETPEKAAIVLGYLPPEWISRVLTKIDPALQSDIAGHLATTRQLLPEQVEDIEQDLKRRLDYLVGGPDRIIAIYESLDPEAQKKMIDNLKDTRPEVVDEIRQRSILFEDMDKFEPAALKTILREVDLQTLVAALRGVPEAFSKLILENVSAGKAEILKEELELNDAVSTKTTIEAQRKVALIARRLQREGHIAIPQGDKSAPQTRFGSTLRSTLKLPPGLQPHDTVVEEGQITAPPPPKESIEERIKRFMGRASKTRERYPSDDQNKGA